MSSLAGLVARWGCLATCRPAESLPVSGPPLLHHDVEELLCRKLALNLPVFLLLRALLLELLVSAVVGEVVRRLLVELLLLGPVVVLRLLRHLLRLVPALLLLVEVRLLPYHDQPPLVHALARVLAAILRLVLPLLLGCSF